ncbi:MAG: cellulose binding domain-containing protein, partial [Eubacterium sp.]|nr:cellulose binding domain-containing protein [Eubacterium sp.]
REYGICAASGTGAIHEKQSNKGSDTMDQYGVSYVAWNLSNKAETSAILRSDCNKTSGFKDSDLSSSGKWLYRMLTGKKATSSKPVTTTKKKKTTTTTKKKTTSAPKKETTTKAKATKAKLSYTIKLVNSWESEGQTFYQYNATIKNKTKKACTQWTVDIAFNEKFTLTDSWNGNYSVKSKKLTISSKDYNGKVAAGGSIDNIGFIVKGSAKLKPTSLS